MCGQLFAVTTDRFQKYSKFPSMIEWDGMARAGTGWVGTGWEGTGWEGRGGWAGWSLLLARSGMILVAGGADEWGRCLARATGRAWREQRSQAEGEGSMGSGFLLAFLKPHRQF